MRLMVESHLIITPSSSASSSSKSCAGMLLARAAVDDDRLGCAEPLGGARDVERGVAAAVDHDAPAEQRLFLAFHGAQHRHRVEDLAPRSPAGM